MRKLLAVIAVLLLLVLIDFGGRWFTEYEVQSTAKNHVANVGSASVSLDQFPFSWNMLLGGKVHDATIDLHDLVVTPMPMSLLRTHVDDLKLDRGKLLDGKARITSTGPIVVTAVINEKNLGNVLNGSVLFRDKYVQVTLPTHVVYGALKVEGREILITDSRYPTKFAMPSTDYLPCQPTEADVRTGGNIVLSCASKSLPPVLLRAMGSKGLQSAATK